MQVCGIFHSSFQNFLVYFFSLSYSLILINSYRSGLFEIPQMFYSDFVVLLKLHLFSFFLECPSACTSGCPCDNQPQKNTAHPLRSSPRRFSSLPHCRPPDFLCFLTPIKTSLRSYWALWDCQWEHRNLHVYSEVDAHLKVSATWDKFLKIKSMAHYSCYYIWTAVHV